MFTYTEPARELPIIDDVDVVVAGGGPAGIGAAVAAARTGARVVLIERYGFLGGTATAGGMACMNGFRNQRPPDDYQTVRGVAQEIVDRMIASGGAQGSYGIAPYCVPFDPNAFKYAALRMCLDAGVELLLHTRCASVAMVGRRVLGVIVETKAERGVVAGQVIVDATGDGDVAAWAGAPFVVAEAPETPLPMGHMFRMGNLEMDELLADLWARPEAFAGRYPSTETSPAPALTMEDAARAGLPIGLAGYTRECFERLGEARAIRMIVYPDRREALVWGGQADADGLDARALSKAEAHTWRETMALVQVLHGAPGFHEAHVIDVAPQVGVRETRRIVGDYILTDADVQWGRQFDDAIAIVANSTPPMDGHPRTYLAHGGYGVPYRCLLPKGVDGLLVAGRHLSASHRAFGNLRAIAPMMVIGQAAGTAAALAAQDDVLPRNVDIPRLRQLLVAQGSVVARMRDT